MEESSLLVIVADNINDGENDEDNGCCGRKATNDWVGMIGRRTKTNPIICVAVKQ